MKRAVARKAFFAIAALLFVLLAASAWKLAGDMDRIDEALSASDDLQIRRFRIAAQLRSRIHRMNSTLFRHQVTGDEALVERFNTLKTQLKRFIEERRPMLDSAEEREILQQIEDGLNLYLTGARNLMAARQRGDQAELAAMRVERIVEMADETVELTNELAAARSEAFRELLLVYRSSARGLKRTLLISFLLTIASAAGLSWMAWKVFFSPLRMELREARALAGQREELANIGTLASGIAHEIRNPITAMKARTFALAELVEPGSPAARQAQIIDQELARMERVVRDFLDFARPAEPDTERTEIDVFLAGVQEFLAPEMEKRNVVLELAPSGGVEARIDRDQMTQVILNLVRNAAEACGAEGGRVTLKAEDRDGKATISVTDNGGGIPMEFRDKLFIPFFSKKHGGTGLGLPIARNIVRKHGGELAFESVEGAGTIFRVELDAAQGG
jgi:signal transduction histidine kinase